MQLLQLLLKATQDKRFVCEEAERALGGMTSWISPNPSLEKLRPYAKHRNPRVRAKAATCVYKSVSRLVSFSSPSPDFAVPFAGDVSWSVPTVLFRELIAFRNNLSYSVLHRQSFISFVYCLLSFQMDPPL